MCLEANHKLRNKWVTLFINLHNTVSFFLRLGTQYRGRGTEGVEEGGTEEEEEQEQ